MAGVASAARQPQQPRQRWRRHAAGSGWLRPPAGSGGGLDLACDVAGWLRPPAGSGGGLDLACDVARWLWPPAGSGGGLDLARDVAGWLRPPAGSGGGLDLACDVAGWLRPPAGRGGWIWHATSAAAGGGLASAVRRPRRQWLHWQQRLVGLGVAGSSGD